MNYKFDLNRILGFLFGSGHDFDKDYAKLKEAAKCIQ